MTVEQLRELERLLRLAASESGSVHRIDYRRALFAVRMELERR